MVTGQRERKLSPDRFDVIIGRLIARAEAQESEPPRIQFPAPDCSECLDSGWKRVPDGGAGRGERCECSAAAGSFTEASRARILKAAGVPEKLIAFDESLVAGPHFHLDPELRYEPAQDPDVISAEAWRRSWKSHVAEGGWQRDYRMSHHDIDLRQWPAIPSCQTIVFEGTNQTGKSTLMAELAWRARKAGMVICWASAQDLVKAHFDSEGAPSRLCHAWLNAGMSVIDDAGQELQGEQWAILSGLIRRRADNGGLMGLTTNMSFYGEFGDEESIQGMDKLIWTRFVGGAVIQMHKIIQPERMRK